MNDQKIAASHKAEWLCPLVSPPPRGETIKILQQGGVEIRGIWKDGQCYLAWHPLLKTPNWLKERLFTAYTRNPYTQIPHSRKTYRTDKDPVNEGSYQTSAN